MKAFFRIFTLAFVLAFGPVCYWLIAAQGMTYLNWFIVAIVPIWLLLFGFWYLIFGRATVGKRFLRFFITVAALFVLGFVASSLLRYEGSSSGSSFPKFSWVWEKETLPSENDPTPAVSTEVSPEEVLAASGDLENFLGPDRNGQWTAPSFGTDWSTTTPQLLWKRPLGKAWSSFVVSGGKAITQEQVEDAERVSCYSLHSGELLWHHDDPGTRLLLEKQENSGAAMGGDGPRATPTIHDGSVYAIGATGILNCLDLETGERRWTRQVIHEYAEETQRWGLANSPLVIPDLELLVVAGSDSPGSTLIAFELDSGEERWVYAGNGASYSSPRLLEFFGVRQIVTVNAQDVTGLLPETGELLWRFEWKGNFPKVGQPQQIGSHQLLVTASYGVGSPLLELQREGNNWQVTEVWRSTRLKTKFSSAAILGNHAYGLDEGRLAAIDLATGNKAWKKEKFGFGQHLLFGEHLLVQAESGEVVIGKISPTGFTETGRISALSGMTWNAPAVAGRILLVRNAQEGAAFLLPDAP